MQRLEMVAIGNSLSLDDDGLCVTSGSAVRGVHRGFRAMNGTKSTELAEGGK